MLDPKKERGKVRKLGYQKMGPAHMVIVAERAPRSSNVDRVRLHGSYDVSCHKP